MDRLYIRWRKLLLGLLVLDVELDQGWKEQDHVASLVHDRCVSVGAADFGRKLVSCCLLCAVVPSQIVVAASEVDILLVKDGCPLEASA